MPSETELEPGSQSPHQRLTGKVHAAFTMACGQRDLAVAELLFSSLELLARHYTDADGDLRTSAVETLADAQAQLATLRAE